MRFVNDVATFTTNKMDLTNLATVFAPNILYSKQTDMAVIDVVNMIFKGGRLLFQVLMEPSEGKDTKDRDDLVKKYEQAFVKI